ncbi:MAG: hypothetical protein ACLP2H_06690 [Terriglobales bacterium]
MKLEKQVFLVLEHSDRVSKHKVRIVESLEDALRTWKPSTRVSPIFMLGPGAMAVDAFKGRQRLLFLGPVHPERVLSWTNPKRAWVSLGLLNLLLIPQSLADSKKIIRWANENRILYEAWDLENGVGMRVASSQESRPATLLPKLATLSAANLAAEVADAVNEYCPLMASTASRCGCFPNEMLSDLEQIHQYVTDTLAEVDSHPDVTVYRVLGQLLTVNAGLSRFSSQTFAGSSPISETECHFWSNSLLGIGIATLGLWHLNSFLEATLGGARIPERFLGLRQFDKDVPDLTRLDINNPFWSLDHLSRVNLKPGAYDPLIPPLTYFSGRDGFKSTPTTISAPLACVSSCNSLRWSLLTLTHEVSHTIVRSVVSELYPDLASKDEVLAALELLEKKHGGNLLEEVRRLLLVTLVQMDAVHAGRRKPVDLDTENLVELVEHWQREVEETLVHVFDFLYFYGKDVEKYVSGIWASWGTIPNITSRIRDYVVRTICTVLAIHLRRKNGEDAARDQVQRILTQLRSDAAGGPFIDRALEYIGKHWDDEIRDRVLARRPIVKVAHTFLFSEAIATVLRGEPEISGGASEKEGYTLRPGHLESRQIRNPLRFLELYTTPKAPSALDSAWMFYILAFCLQRQ